METLLCDRCGRSLAGKGYVEVDGMKICGVCQWEEGMRNVEKDQPQPVFIPYPHYPPYYPAPYTWRPFPQDDTPNPLVEKYTMTCKNRSK